MSDGTDKLKQVQQLVLDVAAVNRYSFIPKTDERENVVEHSMSIALLAWHIHQVLDLKLDMAKVLKYAIAHDFLERGLTQDTNTYASTKEREEKKAREAKELERITQEFPNFDDMTATLHNYEEKIDDESLFVWSVDKMQQSILGEMDSWRPYANYGITYAQYCAKNEEFLNKCLPGARSLFQQLFEHCKTTYYDQP